MKINAWIQMGTERRETVIEIPDELTPPPGKSLETWVEEHVFDWMEVQYGCGWSGAGFENDFSSSEGDDFVVNFVATSETAIPNTRHFRFGREVPRIRD